MLFSICICILLTIATTEAVTQPTPTLVFGATVRVAEAYADSPGSGPSRDGCLVAEKRLASPVISRVVFDAKKGRLRQSNPNLERNPSENITSIGRWDLKSPREWDLINADSGVSCYTELIPPAICPNGTKACPPVFGTLGEPQSVHLYCWHVLPKHIFDSFHHDHRNVPIC